MKLFISAFLVLNFLVITDISEIRKLYPTASESEKSAIILQEKLAGVTNSGDKTLLAYKGASITLKSKFSKNISGKIKYLKQGAKLIEFAIDAEPNNIEIHLIRLSVQENVPAIAPYHSNIDDDKKFILTHFEQSGAIKEYVKNFILQSKSFSDKEKQAVK
ncbi:hypothetical protein [Flavobacterium sp. 3HN19-14]|uniref:hypothetical protein n=1 Tax=Flavobacterium sp. 3HN19-14 TaxID=3448133 RepID=UPI003EE35FEA